MIDVQMTAGVTTGDQFETILYPDDEILLRVTSGGNVQVMEYTSTDREGPPPHIHQWHEVEYVIEGEVEFYVNGQWTQGGPGTVQMLPAGASHSTRVPQGTARLLYITIGPPYDVMARELSALYMTGHAATPDLLEVLHRHGLRLEGESLESDQ